MNRSILIVVVLVLTVAAAFLYLRAASRVDEASATPTPTSPLDATSEPITSPGTSDTASASPTATSLTAAVTMQGSLFSPSMLTIKKGTKVTWTNAEGIQHKVLSLSGPESFGSENNLSRNDTYSFMFTKVGTYQYTCELHRSFMNGTIVVTE